MNDYVFTPQDVYEFVRDNDIEALKQALNQLQQNDKICFYRCPGCSFSAVHHAAYKKGDYLPLLLNAGADIEAKTELSTTPLHIASGLNNTTNVKILLNAGANIEARDCYGRTPLADASFNGNIETASILIENNGDINAIDNQGFSSLDLCTEHSYRCFLFKLLLDKGGVMGRKKIYRAEYQMIMKQKKNDFNKFVEIYVPYNPWKKRLTSRVFPKGYCSNIPVNGWLVATKICKKYYHNEVLTLLHLYVSKVYSNSIPIRATRSYSTKFHQCLKMNMSNESNKTYLLMSILSNEIKAYLDDVSFL